MRKIIVFFALCLAAVSVSAAAMAAPGKPQTALFAGGCFWSMESAFEKVYGVISAVSGYTGGKTKNPTYGNYGIGGHVEAVLVTWDPARVSYDDLLTAYWHHTDPTDGGGQFVDRGPNYRPVVYWMDEAQRTQAEASRAALGKGGKLPGPVATEIAKAGAFYPAEAYHQDYTRKNPDNYQAYYNGSGRAAFFAKVWGPSETMDSAAPPTAKNGAWTKPSPGQLKSTLNAMQYDVTQNDGTEPAFNNEYWNNEKAGIYVDIVSGEPLFSSTDKFDSGTGWPSFTMALAPANVLLIEDRSLGMVRVEVRSRYADSHLGHLFDDGPAPTGMRYCMDSASLRFIAVADMQKAGYGQFLKLFNK